VVVVCSCDLVGSILEGTYFPRGVLSDAVGAFFAFVQLVVALVFCVIAIRLLRQLRVGLKIFNDTADLGSSRVRFKKQIKSLTHRILISAIGMLVFVGGTTLVPTPFFRRPNGMMITFIIILFGLNITSIAQIIAFAVPIQEKKAAASFLRVYPSTPMSQDESKVSNESTHFSH